MSGIKGKVVIITGASSGIGKATSLLLASRGATVVLGARSLDRLEALTGVIAAGTKNAVRTISEGLRQEAGDKLRVTLISPGFVHTDFAESMTNPEVKSQIVEARDKTAIAPDAIARAIAFAIEQPSDVDVGEIVVRPTAQG
jgi:NADP-dependent 3-hydroxy acid dehydrogenase YdfG